MNNLKHLFLLLVSPGKSWQRMAKAPCAMQSYLNKFLYPLMGVTALAALLQYFVIEISLSRALQLAIIEFVKFFAGFYALTYTMKAFSNNLLEVVQPDSRIQCFVGHTLGLFMLLDICLFIVQLFVPLSGIVEFLPLLWIYVIWYSQKYMEIPEQKGIMYVVTTTILFLAIPLAIQKLLEILMPTVN